jgi:hypothetical protein
MKSTIKHLAMLSALVAFAGCNLANGEVKSEAETKEALHTHQPKKVATHTNVISGKIQSIDREKDGYAAELLTEGGDTYYLIVSQGSLITPTQYREFKTGELVTVVGEHWEMKGMKHLTVHIIQ